MTTQKTYAQPNALTVTGRIFAAEIAENNGGEFLAVTVITNLVNGDGGTTISFNNSNGLMSLFNKGYLPVGREVTVTGHIAGVKSTYEKGGKVYDLKRPNIHLTGANILDGGLGRMPADKSEGSARRTPAVAGRTPSVDATPKVENDFE